MRTSRCTKLHVSKTTIKLHPVQDIYENLRIWEGPTKRINPSLPVSNNSAGSHLSLQSIPPRYSQYWFKMKKLPERHNILR